MKSQRYGRGALPCALTGYRALVLLHYLFAHPLVDEFAPSDVDLQVVFEE
jgi:hypothetical protein